MSMATVTTFDNINKLTSVITGTVYVDSFETMDITPQQKKRRRDLADMLEDDLLFLFTLYIMAYRYGETIDRARVERQYVPMVRESLKQAGIRDEIAERYIEEIVPEEIRVTEQRFKENDYWTSPDRAETISEDDSNVLWNNQEYLEAVESGKTMKQWLTMKDERVRATHREVDDVVIPIDEAFVVGNYLMMYPGDSSLGAGLEEIVACRCSVTYL